MSKPRTTWDDDRVQFPRLLAELRAVGLTQDQYAGLCESMDLGVAEIHGLLERAETAWSRIKECSHEHVAWDPIAVEYHDDGRASVWQQGRCTSCQRLAIDVYDFALSAASFIDEPLPDDPTSRVLGAACPHDAGTRGGICELCGAEL